MIVWYLMHAGTPRAGKVTHGVGDLSFNEKQGPASQPGEEGTVSKTLQIGSADLGSREKR